MIIIHHCPHLGHHSNILLSISPAGMATLLKSTRSHAHSYPLYLGLIPYALISNMVFPVHAINVVKYPQLSCTNPIFFSLSNGLISDLNPVHQCTLDCRVK